MDNYQGDLTDIVRASGGAALGRSSDIVPIWEFSTSSDNDMIRDNIFGDPFCNMRDPLLHELNVAAGSSYFSTSSGHHNSPADMLSTSNFVGANISHASSSTCTNILPHQKEVFEDDEMHRTTATTPPLGAPPPCNIFSRIQISPSNNINPVKLSVSPCDSPVMATSSPRSGFKAAAAASAMVSSEMINVNSPKGCLIENTGPVQISSPRNLGIKRRKSQAKKVVCIPAPAAANSRPSSGEVVPSDLWAWRKYGQKPIKGSPYPRGYYRCSSSKGCSARKQVERSRTDPNMLVITYTSEHNHPWPTQRNALAGSTRSTQPPKNNNNNNAAASKSSSTGTTTTTQSQKPKEEQRGESSSNDTSLSPTINNNIASSSTAVKEEIEDIEKQIMEMDNDNNDFSSEGFSQSYRPALPDHHQSCSQSEDFFADLGEIEATDPLDLLFTQGGFNDHDEEQKESKTNLDPFSIFDWSGDTK